MTKCTCLRPAAKSPTLLQRIFKPTQAQKQAKAAQAHKCVGCYEIDCYTATCKTRRTQS